MPSDKETIQCLYDLLRAVVFKFGRDVSLTRSEFVESLGGNFTIKHVPQDDVTFLRVWSVHERSDDRVSSDRRKKRRQLAP
jgi:hypothetical protein